MRLIGGTTLRRNTKSDWKMKGLMMNKSFYNRKNEFHSGAGNKDKFMEADCNKTIASNWIDAGGCGKSSLYIKHKL